MEFFFGKKWSLGLGRIEVHLFITVEKILMLYKRVGIFTALKIVGIVGAGVSEEWE